MVVAVSYKDEEIYEHFGHAEMFAIYDYDENNEFECTKRLIDCSALHGHKEMADLMRENHVDAVIVGNMGAEARALLLSYGIVPIVGYCGHADTAADLLVAGQLPIVEGGGGCGGGCSGCSGSCGGGCGDEGGDCGCGCGGH